MAIDKGVHFLSFCLYFLVLFLCLLAQQVADEKCKKPWYVHLSEEIVVSWTGEDRDAVVTANIVTPDIFGRDCDSNLSLVAKFSDRNVRPKRPCSNALYTVAVTLVCGKVTMHQNMTKRTPPEAPPAVYLKPTSTSITVQWSPTVGRVLTYEVRCKTTEPQREKEAQIENPDGSVKYERKTSSSFYDLIPYTEYKVTVLACNEEYCGLATSAIVRTLEGVPFAPRNLMAKEVTVDRITLEWDAPKPEVGHILRYNILWSEDGKTELSRDSSNITSYVLRNLYPYTAYYAEVSAVNLIGVGAAANVTQKTKLAVPDTPELEISSVTNTTITVRWKLSELYRGPNPTYRLRWKMETKEEFIAVRTVEAIFGMPPTRVGKYTITELEPFTSYQIQIQALNDAGSGSWSTSLKAKTLTGIPSSPKNLKVLSKSSSHIEIAWDVPDPSYGIILQYEVRMGFVQTDRYYTDATNFSMTELQPYTEYGFKVCAETEAGWGDFTDLLRVTTDVGVPSEPSNVSIVERTSDSVEIEWSAPEYMNAPYVAYVICWWKTVDPEETENITAEDFSSCEEETEVNVTTLYTIRQLDSYTNYSVRVCAKTAAGRGNFTEPIIVQTMAGVPDAPTKVKATDVKSTEIMIKWDRPKKTRGPLEGYKLRWGVEGTIGSYFHTTENSYRALGLRPYTEYFFEVSAKSEGGTGKSRRMYMRTDISTPSVPRHLEVVSKSDHCIFLQWAEPENPNAPLVQYSVEWKEVSSSVEQSRDTNTTSYRIINLVPLTNYSVRISPRTAAGRGPSTEWLYVQTKTKDASTAIISGSVVGALVVVFLIGGSILFFFLRKKNAQQCKPVEKSVETPHTTTTLPLVPLTDSKKINVGNFDEHILNLMTNSYYKLAQEYEQLGRESPAFPTNEAKKNDNLAKNRWMKILPFDHSRVKLLPIGDEVEPDYINASYVPGDSYLLEYIAAQGPLSTTVDDFWKMVWQESVFLIVMLTQCVERAKRNCEQYWPQPGTSARYGVLEVRAVSENITPTFTQRLFLVSQDGKQRHVSHLHYTVWPVSGSPKSPDDFLTFVQTVRSQMGCSTTGPLLVHCSAGIGRTGTFIAVDRLSQQLSKQDCDDIDIYGTVLEMRRYRPNLVQTEEQYYFIYLCVQRLIQQKRLSTEDDYGGGIYAN